MSFVELVEHEYRDPIEKGIADQTAGENPLGHIPELGALAAAALVAHLKTDFLSDPSSTLRSDEVGRGARRDTSRFEHDDRPAVSERIDQRRGHARRLSRAGRCVHHDSARRANGIHETRKMRVNEAAARGLHWGEAQSRRSAEAGADSDFVSAAAVSIVSQP